MSKQTVILRAEGCVHTYNDLTPAAADLLYRALCVYSEGECECEVWQGMDLIAYNGITPRSIVKRARAHVLAWG